MWRWAMGNDYRRLTGRREGTGNCQGPKVCQDSEMWCQGGAKIADARCKRAEGAEMGGRERD
jgi:hypothetical protein